jgi:hypothetical protein
METSQQLFPMTRVADEGVSLEISDAWSFDADPNADVGSSWPTELTAGAPDGSPILEIRQEADEDGEVASAVDVWEAELRDGTSMWEDVVVGSRSTITVPGAVVAERFEYTGEWEGQRYAVAEVWTSDGETLTYLRVYDLESDIWNMRATIEATVASLRLED